MDKSAADNVEIRVYNYLRLMRDIHAIYTELNVLQLLDHS